MDKAEVFEFKLWQKLLVFKRLHSKGHFFSIKKQKMNAIFCFIQNLITSDHTNQSRIILNAKHDNGAHHLCQ